MNTSNQISLLAEPNGDNALSRKTLGYISTYARLELFDHILEKLEKSGVSKADIAKRLAKDPAQISRLLGAPGNWTIDTFAELLFAIDGSMLRPDSFQPMREPTANLRHSTLNDSDCLEISNGPSNTFDYLSEPTISLTTNAT